MRKAIASIITKDYLSRFIRYALVVGLVYGLWRLLADSLGLRGLLLGIKQETWLAIFTLIFSTIFGSLLQRQKDRAIALQVSQEANRALIEQSNADIIKFARQIEDRVDDLAVKQSAIASHLTELKEQLKDLEKNQHQVEKDVVAMQSALHTSFILGHKNFNPPESV